MVEWHISAPSFPCCFQDLWQSWARTQKMQLARALLRNYLDGYPKPLYKAPAFAPKK